MSSGISRNPLSVLLSGFTAAVGAVTGTSSVLGAIQRLWGNAHIGTSVTLTGTDPLVAAIDASAGSGRTYRITTATTTALRIDINNLPTGNAYWECQIMLLTTAVPVSISWGGATVNYMTFLSFNEYPVQAGRMSRVILSRQLDGASTRVTAFVYPAGVTT